jgi:antitoxin component YwqK of YwqJK toxin-antitoxin module
MKKIETCHYKNDELNGEQIKLYESSQKQTTRHYKNGKENGIRQEWDEDGKLTNYRNYIYDAEE